MKSKPINYGLLLTAITLVIFFAVYFFFIDSEYYMISAKVNFFVLPFIYTLLTIILLYKKTNVKKLSFFKCLQYSFSTLLIGGTLSYLFIAFFFNVIDKNSEKLLRNQRLEQSLKELNKDYKSLQNPTEEDTYKYKMHHKSLTSESLKNEPLFNLKNSFIILIILYLFYFTISVLLSIFFRTRISNANLNNYSSTQ